MGRIRSLGRRLLLLCVMWSWYWLCFCVDSFVLSFDEKSQRQEVYLSYRQVVGGSESSPQLMITVSIDAIDHSIVTDREHLELEVLSLCASLSRHSCRRLYRSLRELSQRLGHDTNSASYESPFTAPHEIKNAPLNPHLRRHRDADRAERISLSLGHAPESAQRLLRQIDEVLMPFLRLTLEQRIDRFRNQHRYPPHRQALRELRRERGTGRKGKQWPMNLMLLHSCGLSPAHSLQYSPSSFASTRILQELLEEIDRSSLAHNLLAAVVLHYGRPLPSAFTRLFPSTLFLHVSEEIGFFELPTIHIVKACSQFLLQQQNLFAAEVLHETVAVSGSHRNTTYSVGFAVPQILYLHTKGQSYAYPYQQMEDWRRYMSFFAIHRHASANALLNSQQFDAVGVNYVPQFRAFSGNMWWATARYLSQLPDIDWLSRDKYAAELWVLYFATARVYSYFNTDVNLADSRGFPRYCYTSTNRGHNLEKVDSQRVEEWSTVIEQNHCEVLDFSEIRCHSSWDANDDRDDYSRSLDNQQAHVDEALVIPPFDLWRRDCPMMSVEQYRYVHRDAALPLEDDLPVPADPAFACPGITVGSRARLV